MRTALDQMSGKAAEIAKGDNVTMNEDIVATTRHPRSYIHAVVTVVAVLAMSNASATDGWQKSSLSLDGMKATIEHQPPPSMEFSETRSEGRHVGCGLTYDSWRSDADAKTSRYATSKKGLTYISGGLLVAVFRKNEKVALLLGHKIKLIDLEARSDGAWEKKSAVNYAYLRDTSSLGGRGPIEKQKTEARTTVGKEYKVTKDGSSRSFVYNLLQDEGEKSLFTLILLTFDPIVGFNRSPGSVDTEISLKSKEWSDFKMCLANFAGQNFGFDRKK